MTTDETLSFLKKKSIEIILNGQSPSGAYIAGPTFTVYKFSWFRDGSFIADAMSRVGEVKSAEAFFDWGARIIRSKKESLLNGGVLHARYTAEGEESSDEWPTFQLDGFGTFIWALCGHAERHHISTERWDDVLQIISDYLVKKWREPSFDWWEEYSAIHPATLASIYAGLVATHNSEAVAVKSAIDLKNAKLDGSLIVCATPFHAVTIEEFAPTLEEIENKLVSPSGGVHRHQTDVYYGGGEWLLLTSFLGWHYHEIGRENDARKKLIRMASFSRPLLWSHAMFLTLATVLNID